MNIFVVDPNPKICAEALDDLRLNKMILETAQILSTTVRVLGYYGSNVYKATHINHPCTVWARQSKSNYLWLLDYLQSLLSERHIRTGKTHKTAQIVHTLRDNAYLLPEGSLTPFVNCTKYADLRVDKAYKLTLMDKWNNDKRPPTWTNTEKPNWTPTEGIL